MAANTKVFTCVTANKQQGSEVLVRRRVCSGGGSGGSALRASCVSALPDDHRHPTWYWPLSLLHREGGQTIKPQEGRRCLPGGFPALGRDRWCHRATHGSPWAKRDPRTHLVSTQRLVDVVSVGCLHLKLGDFTPSQARCQVLPQCTASAKCHSPWHLPGTVPHILCLAQALSLVTSPAHRHVGSQTLG